MYRFYPVSSFLVFSLFDWLVMKFSFQLLVWWEEFMESKGLPHQGSNIIMLKGKERKQ